MFGNMRMVSYLMVLFYLGIMERIRKYLEEKKIRHGIQVKPEGHNIPSVFESASESRSSVH